METYKKSKTYIRQVFRLYMIETLRHKSLFLLVLFGVIGAQAANLAVPVLMREFFNILASQNTNALVAHKLSIVIGFIGLTMFVRWAFYRVQVWNISTLESRVMSHLTVSSFDYLIKHSHNFFASQFAGTLTRRITKYSNAFEAIFDAIVMNFLPTAIFVIGAVVVLSIYNYTLGAMLGAWTIVFISIQIYFSRLHRPMRVLRTIEDSKMSGAIADAIGNHNTITVFAGLQKEYKRLAQFAERWRMAQLRAWHFAEFFWGIQGILIILINVVLLYGAMYFWQRGELTIGDFVLIQTYLIGTVEMLHNVTSQLRRFYDSLADAEEMVAILEEPHEIQDVPNAVSLAISDGQVDFRDVSFHFDEERSILEHFNLVIRAGEKVALVGPSGAGKSTITKLLLRLYDVTGGVIEIDGQNIAEVQQASLHNAIGFVPQESVLFHRSLIENIRYGKRDATDEEVIEAAKKANCHEFIEKLSEGYGTLVGERGVKLSGGERQRVSIARAILKDAPILVLDEATSSLDSESESLIQDSLRVLMQGKTVLVIAHRLSTIMNMDRIIVLQDGSVAADGTHAELLAQGGLYQKLWSIQAGGFLQDGE